MSFLVPFYGLVAGWTRILRFSDYGECPVKKQGAKTSNRLDYEVFGQKQAQKPDLTIVGSLISKA